MKQLNPEQKLEFVKGLYDTWKSRQEEVREMIGLYPEWSSVLNGRRLTGNVEFLSELTEQEFTSDIDMMRKASRWIKKTEGELEAKFKKKLYEAALNKYRRKKKSN